MDGWNTSFLLGWPIFRAMLVLGRVNFPNQNLGLRICKFDPVLKSEDEDYGHDV